METNNKEERQAKRANKRQAKVDAYRTKLKSEALESGVDVDNPPVGVGGTAEPTKADTDKKLMNFAKQPQKEGLGKFQNIYKAPNIEDPKAPTIDPTIKDVRRAKRAHIADILSSFSKGWKGEQVNPNEFRDRIKGERLAQYEKFKEASQKGKEQLKTWNDDYIQKQLDYLNGLKDTETDELEKKKLQAEINKIRRTGSGSQKVKPIYTHQTNQKNWAMTNQANPYSDLYYKLAGDSPEIINEFARMSGYAEDDTGGANKNLSTQEIEMLSNNLISSMFDIKIDQQGNRVAVPRPGMENYLDELKQKANTRNSVAKIDKELKTLNLQLQAMGDEGTSVWEINDKPKRQALEAQIKELEQNKADLSKGATEEKQQSPNQSKSNQNQKSIFFDVINGNK